MAHNQEGFNLPLKAASAIAQYVPVRGVGEQVLTPGSALSETVVRAGSINEMPLGFTIATAASPGDPVAVQVDGVVKAKAGASLGAFARVGVGSTNGVLAPYAPSGGHASADLGTIRWTVGVALKNAAAGDYFPVLIDPDLIV